MKPTYKDVCFWLMSLIAICILIAYMVSTSRLEKRIEDLEKNHQETVKELTERAAKLQDKLLAQQDEVAEVERKKAEEAKKQAQKKARLDFIRDEVTCLAENLYHEAAFEPDNGKLAVATVVMNRVASPGYPKTVCGVVYERHIKKDSDKIVCMFSWTCKPKMPMQPSVYQKVLDMAREVYFKHERCDDVADATLYHAAYIKSPNWADPDNLVATIGQHLFYRQ